MLERIDDGKTWTPKPVCRHPDHDPPSMIVLEPGRYRHTCPGCGRSIEFTVPQGPSWSAISASDSDCLIGIGSWRPPPYNPTESRANYVE